MAISWVSTDVAMSLEPPTIVTSLSVLFVITPKNPVMFIGWAFTQGSTIVIPAAAELEAAAVDDAESDVGSVVEAEPEEQPVTRAPPSRATADRARARAGSARRAVVMKILPRSANSVIEGRRGVAVSRRRREDLGGRRAR